MLAKLWIAVSTLHGHAHITGGVRVALDNKHAVQPSVDGEPGAKQQQLLGLQCAAWFTLHAGMAPQHVTLS